MIAGPSLHLSWKELACKDGTPYPLIWRTNRAIHLAEIFELIRAECGNQPITVLSAYRTPEWNQKIGGAKNSQHMQGRALDLRPPKGMKLTQFYLIIKKLSQSLPIGGIGLYKTFIHVDTREGKRVAVWHGSGVKDDVSV